MRPTDPVEHQLAQVAERLLAEVAGDASASPSVRAHLAAVRAQFAGATVTQFLPILVEREVRRRLRADDGARAGVSTTAPSDRVSLVVPPTAVPDGMEGRAASAGHRARDFPRRQGAGRLP